MLILFYEELTAHFMQGHQEKNMQDSSAPSYSPLSDEYLKTVSHSPGVYQMLGKREVLYVGKARDLRKRLSQYAHYSGPIHSKTAVMLSHVQRVETILTTTEKEALILEASLIKKHLPRYNVILRDDKNYPLIKVTIKDDWPRLHVTRRRLRDGNRYFGPYTSSTALRASLHLLFSMFPLRRCRTISKRERPCLNYQMKRCLAPCCGLVSQEEYGAMVDEVILILEGKSKKVIDRLEKKMRVAAAQLAFEEAALYRDQIQGLGKTLERQTVFAEHQLDQDVFGIARHNASVGIALLFVRAGMVSGAQTFFINDPLGEDDHILRETIFQYYSEQRQPPRELLLPLSPEDEDLVLEQLRDLRQGVVDLRVPQRGKRMQLMQMAAENAHQIFAEQSKKEKSWETLARSLEKFLKLRQHPDTIECLDISNLAGKQPVGSLVCFRRGEKEASRFRHYRIRLKDEPDDYAMMNEVLERRMETGLEKDNLPDLLLLDGGKGQLNIAVNVLARFDLLNRVDLVSIAKEKQEEGEKLFRPGRKDPILLPAHSPALLYLMRIRDESHRFGITFHRKLRNKATLHSRLDTLEGIGEKRKTLLLKKLGSYKRIMEATVDELSAVPGIGRKTAESVYRQLHEGGGRK
ncbi:MAG: excinuclease ABC subunit UvrC [Candidatus Electrothrix aestuarii]|uniref:UvrABC system protein C n=1 Tax=Candidatus Electrothrix aestuarii TaxID=3062594 RepID=A0AAU8LZG6_9BACT|nr:excinuclease ABC subunit UvrC [Candidatus Electrothrix aestuarii]